MVRRCRETKHYAYPRYGGRGIKVCDRWLEFGSFYADMGQKPDGKSLDRIDNDGHYEPSNCRWATKYEQDNNRRSNRLFTFDGQTRTIAEWARHTGIKVGRLYDRLLTQGWAIERALSEPSGPARGEHANKSKLTGATVVAIRADRESGLSLPKLAAKYSVSVGTVWRICRRDTWTHIA